MRKDRPTGIAQRIALVGCSGLIGQEIKERLSTGQLCASDVRLFETESHEGALSEFKGEAAVAVGVDRDSFIEADLVFLACPRDEARGLLDYPRKPGAFVIDLSGAAAGLAAPVVNLSVNPEALDASGELVQAAQPAALVLSSLLHALDSAARVVGAEAVVFEPASGLGQEAIDELYRQAVNLLNFSPVPQETFGRQMAFNLLPLSLAPSLGGRDREELVETQVVRILRWEPSRLSVKLLLAGVFHCHSVSLRATLAGPVDLRALRRRFAEGAEFEITAEPRGGPERDTPVEWAGEAKIRIAEMRPDSRGAIWIWALADDLKAGAAQNAVKIAEALITSVESSA